MFQVGANEQDHFQLLTAGFIINSSKVNKFIVYPWIHDLSNRQSMDEVTSPISFPGYYLTNVFANGSIEKYEYY